MSLSAPSIFGGAPAVIERVFNHPNYTSVTQRRFDIALIKVRPPPFEPPTFGTVKLNARSDRPADEAFVRVSGFGKSTDEPPTMSNFGSLRFADIPVYPFSKCRAAYKTVPAVGLLSGQRQLCAGYARGGCDACAGDSGGPLVQFDDDGNVVQVAVVSAAKGCALAGFPGINARVDAVLDWMRSVGAQFDTGVPVQQFRNGGILGGQDKDDGKQEARPRPSKSSTPTPLPVGAPVPPPPPPPPPLPPRPVRTPPPRASSADVGPRPPPGAGQPDAAVQPSAVPEAAAWAPGGEAEDDEELIPDASVEADDGDGEGGLQTGGDLQGSGGPRSPSDTRQAGGGVNVLALVLGVVGGAAALVAVVLVFVLRR